MSSRRHGPSRASARTRSRAQTRSPRRGCLDEAVAHDGYLGLAATADASVRTQVNAVNIKRRALYSQLASSRGVAPGDVGLTAGCELLGRVAVGEAYLLADNRWRRRTAGQSAPVPDYCG